MHDLLHLFLICLRFSNQVTYLLSPNQREQSNSSSILYCNLGKELSAINVFHNYNYELSQDKTTLILTSHGQSFHIQRVKYLAKPIFWVNLIHSYIVLREKN